MIWRVKAMTMGRTSTVWARIIAFGVNSQPSEPSGPERDSSRKIARPATTGGRPMRAFTSTITTERPGKRARPSRAPSGMPMSAASSDRRERDAQRQADDLQELRIEANDQVEGGPEGRCGCHTMGRWLLSD